MGPADCRERSDWPRFALTALGGLGRVRQGAAGLAALNRGHVSKKPSVYIETSVISYLTSRPSRDLIRAAHQTVTQQWWEQRHRFALYASQSVIHEARAGDSLAASRRLAVLDELPTLELTDAALRLASGLLAGGGLPATADLDAAHIAIAAVHQMSFLLTWNCRHIANPITRPRIEELCRQAGYTPPVICTPWDLLGQEEQP